MLSASSNARYPGRTAKQYVLAAENDEGNSNQLAAEHVQLWSFEEPALPTGHYSIRANQKVQENQASSHDFQELARSIHVPGPKFRLLNPDDIHSVYPAPGQSEHSNTLAHIVFKQPTLPWERHIIDSRLFNRVPWLAVLTFVEEELILTNDILKQIDVKLQTAEPTRYGTFASTAGDLQQYSRMACTLNAPHFDTDFTPTDKIDVLPLKTAIFDKLVKRVDDKDKTQYDVESYASMAHIREVHPGFTASLDHGESPVYSVVISPRTGPVDVVAPTRVISHLISLEGISNLNTTNREYVALVSLYSWDWMCIPPDHESFAQVMTGFSNAVQPLRVPDAFTKKLTLDVPEKWSTWLHDRLLDGFTLKPFTTITGEKTQSLIRGPFIPVMPSRKNEDMGHSLVGNDLVSLDTETGLPDVSYSMAWNLGRSAALADRAFCASLLRLRGKVRAEATRRLKTSAQEGDTGLSSYLKGLKVTFDDIAGAHTPTGLASSNATARWYRTPDQKRQGPVAKLSSAGSFNQPSYLKVLPIVMREFFGLPGENGTKNPSDPDAIAVQKWAIDKLYLSGVPLHYLVMDPDMLPHETIRTFCVDPTWVDALIDGGLSLANHHANDDDSLRREIKKAINETLETAVKEGPNSGQLIREPRWGILVRSIAVTAFPDLKVEAHFETGGTPIVSEALYMQILADDVLLCLLDKMPGEGGFTELVLTQPNHQQSYSLGHELTDSALSVKIRPVPSDPTIVPDPKRHIPLEWNRATGSPFYNWDTHVMSPRSFAQTAIEAMGKVDGNYFRWGKADDVPSSYIASQLSKPILQLRLAIAPEMARAGTGNAMDGLAPRKLFVAPFKANVAPEPDKQSLRASTRPPPAHAPLITGPRPPPTKVVLGQNDIPQVGVLNEEMLEQLDQKAMVYQEYPQVVYIWSLSYAMRNSCVGYSPEPMDLVFMAYGRLDEPTSSNPGPTSIEVRIPVTLQSGPQPAGVNSQLPTILTIPGTAALPVLPRVYPLTTRGLRFSFSTKLVLGRLYPEKSPGDHVDPAPEADLQVLLVITARCRVPVEKMTAKGYEVDASFVLGGAIVGYWEQGSTPRDAMVKYNLVWNANVSMVQSRQVGLTTIDKVPGL